MVGHEEVTTVRRVDLAVSVDCNLKDHVRWRRGKIKHFPRCGCLQSRKVDFDSQILRLPIVRRVEKYVAAADRGRIVELWSGTDLRMRNSRENDERYEDPRWNVSHSVLIPFEVPRGRSA